MKNIEQVLQLLNDSPLSDELKNHWTTKIKELGLTPEVQEGIMDLFEKEIQSGLQDLGIKESEIPGVNEKRNEMLSQVQAAKELFEKKVEEIEKDLKILQDDTQRRIDDKSIQLIKESIA